MCISLLFSLKGSVMLVSFRFCRNLYHVLRWVGITLKLADEYTRWRLLVETLVTGHWGILGSVHMAFCTKKVPVSIVSYVVYL